MWQACRLTVVGRNSGPTCDGSLLARRNAADGRIGSIYNDPGNFTPRMAPGSFRRCHSFRIIQSPVREFAHQNAETVDVVLWRFGRYRRLQFGGRPLFHLPMYYLYYIIIILPHYYQSIISHLHKCEYMQSITACLVYLFKFWTFCCRKPHKLNHEQNRRKSFNRLHYPVPQPVK